MLEIIFFDSPNDPVVLSWEPYSSHILSSRDTTRSIYRERTYLSHLLLPPIPRDYLDQKEIIFLDQEMCLAA